MGQQPKVDWNSNASYAIQIRERAVCEEGEKRGGESEGRWCSNSSSSSRGGMYGVGDGGGDGGGGFRRKLLGL